MYRLYKEVDGAWQLEKEAESVADGYVCPKGYRLEMTDGAVNTILQENPLDDTSDRDSSTET